MDPRPSALVLEAFLAVCIWSPALNPWTSGSGPPRYTWTRAPAWPTMPNWHGRL